MVWPSNVVEFLLYEIIRREQGENLPKANFILPASSPYLHCAEMGVKEWGWWWLHAGGVVTWRLLPYVLFTYFVFHFFFFFIIPITFLSKWCIFMRIFIYNFNSQINSPIILPFTIIIYHYHTIYYNHLPLPYHLP